MQIGKLDHVNLRTNQLDKMIDWYTNILGMRSGLRPDFQFPGAWMYGGDDASVHLVEVDGDREINEVNQTLLDLIPAEA